MGSGVLLIPLSGGPERQCNVHSRPFPLWLQLQVQNVIITLIWKT